MKHGPECVCDTCLLWRAPRDLPSLSDDKHTMLKAQVGADFKEQEERFEKLRSIVERQLVANQRDRERIAYLERIVKQYLLDMEKGEVP